MTKERFSKDSLRHNVEYFTKEKRKNVHEKAYDRGFR